MPLVDHAAAVFAFSISPLTICLALKDACDQIEAYWSLLQGLKEIPYGQWREYDAEDAVRFHALWMREVGVIKNSPQEIIARGTDWRFLNELKRELKV